jgi:hypothetical protein
MLVSTPVRLVFDMTELRPMCAIVQAMYTDDYSKVGHFNTESWLTAPVGQMQLFELTPEQFEKVVKTMNVRFPVAKLGRKTG